MPFDTTQPDKLTDDEEKELTILKNARFLIRKRINWWRGGIVPYGYCAMMAINKAMRNHNASFDTGFRAWDRLHNHLPRSYGNIMDYNDSSFTTHADILKLFDSAIAELEVRNAV